MFRLIALNFFQKSPHFSLLSPTSPCELSEREVTSPSNLKVVGALRYVEKYLYYHKNDSSATIFGMMREERSLKFKFES
jgi:hypothetical protein